MNVTTDNGMITPPGDSSEAEVKSDLTTTLFYKIFRVYVQMFIVIIGLIGNALTIVVMRRGKSRHSSATPFLICLAICDNVYLIIGTAIVPLLTYLGFKDLYTFNLPTCVIYFFSAYFTAQLSAWLITAVTMERVGIVVMPHKSKSLFTKKCSYYAIILIIVVLIIENGHIFFAHKMVKIDGENACLIRKQFEYFSVNIWPWLDTIMYNFLPFFIIIICNIIIISVVVKSSRHRQSMTATTGGKETKSDSETTRMTQMLLAISFFFIVTTTPISMYLLFANPNDPDRTSEKSLNFIIVNVVASLNHSCNFIMYSLSGPTFRTELIKVMTCKKSTDNYSRSASSVYASQRTLNSTAT